MVNRSGQFALFVWLGTCAAACFGQPTLVETNFDSDLEGWTVISIVGSNRCGMPGSGRLSQSSFEPANGDPGGHMRHFEPAENRTSLFRAPSTYHGDLSAAYGGVIGWSWRTSNEGSANDIDDIYIQGAGMTIWAATPKAVGRWGRVYAPLVEGVWRVSVAGTTSCANNPSPFATAAQIQAVLSDVTALLIRAEFRSGPETNDLDSVAVFLPITGTPTDDFEAGPAGWSARRDGDLQWGSSFGNGDAGLRCEDLLLNSQVRFSLMAPPKYLGDRSDLIGKTVRLDVRSSAGLDDPDAAQGAEDFLVIGSGTNVARFDLRKLPVVGDAWRTHLVPLVASPAWTDPDGTEISSEAFESILSAVSWVQVRAEYRAGGEMTFLDNVQFGVGDPSVNVTPASLEGCFGESVVLDATAGGDAPFAFAWFRDGAPLMDDGVFAGTATATLEFLVPDSSLDGVYECRVTNTLGQVASNVVVLDARSCCLGDTNGDGLLTPADFSAWIMAFNNQAPECDQNSDGLCTPADFSAWILNFNAGCP